MTKKTQENILYHNQFTKIYLEIIIKKLLEIWLKNKNIYNNNKKLNANY